MRNDIYAFGSKTAVFGKKNMICCAVYASDICLFDGSYTPSVPWQTSTCKHAAAQAWIQSCFYKIQLLQECNICQFQRAALLHILSSDATDPRREVFNTYAVLHKHTRHKLTYNVSWKLSETSSSGNCFSMTTHKRPSSQDQHHKRYQLHFTGNYIFTP